MQCFFRSLFKWGKSRFDYRIGSYVFRSALSDFQGGVGVGLAVVGVGDHSWCV